MGLFEQVPSLRWADLRVLKLGPPAIANCPGKVIWSELFAF